MPALLRTAQRTRALGHHQARLAGARRVVVAGVGHTVAGARHLVAEQLPLAGAARQLVAAADLVVIGVHQFDASVVERVVARVHGGRGKEEDDDDAHSGWRRHTK